MATEARIHVEYEPRFLEEVVLRAAAARPEGRLLHRERERCYAVPDAETRGQTFEALAAAWGARLGLDRPIRDALAEQPLIAAGVDRVGVGRPPRPGATGAELLVRTRRPGEPAAASRRLRLLLAPDALLDPARLLPFLRRELQHVADMLDPRFGYAPHLPAAAGGPAHERLLRDRYRVVWDVTVDGRLLRAGRLPRTVREERRVEFLRTFPALGAEGGFAFARFFLDPSPTHTGIADFVTRAAGLPRAAGACALCGFPTTDLEPAPAALPAEALREIGDEFPAWQPADGCCRQCADLYRARRLSRAGAAALPGVR
jgi:hypothetical protein